MSGYCRSRTKGGGAAGWITICLALSSFSALAAAKTDVVVLKNGDRVTGEVKGLERGKLTLKTDAMGTIYIQWEDIAEVISEQNVEVEIDTGEKYFGVLASDAEAVRVDVRGAERTDTLDLASVIRIVPIEDAFWKRLDGSLDLGFSFASGNDSTQFSVGSEVRHRTRKFLRSVGFDSSFFDQKDAERTKRQSLDASWQRFLPRRRFTNLALQFQQNEELGLELRSLVAAVYGRHAVQSSNYRLDLFAGLAENREDFVGSDPNTSTELVGGLDLAYFKFDDPETDITLDFFVFPSLSNSGRVRAELKARVKREIVKDFFWAISLYDSFDNEPPMEDFPTNDWGFNTSLGWKF